MMSRINKFILFAFFLYVIVNSSLAVLAEENTAGVGVIANRPHLEYKASGLRDPFQTYIIKGKAAASVKSDTTKYTELKVQGIIWGTKMPQAIINDKVYIIGDKIGDAEVASIDKDGVNLTTPSGVVNLAAPG